MTCSLSFPSLKKDFVTEALFASETLQADSFNSAKEGETQDISKAFLHFALLQPPLNTPARMWRPTATLLAHDPRNPDHASSNRNRRLPLGVQRAFGIAPADAPRFDQVASG